MIMHYRPGTNEERPAITCRQCGKPFYTVHEYAQHVEEAHAEESS